MPSNVYLPGNTTIEPTILSPTGLDLSLLDVDAVRAVTRLIDRGFEAYLVGGCVRDLLLDRSPKDYDLATEARPPQIKRTFPRNCRIIGRRFKLAHLHFHGNTKILECSTFRRTPEEGGNGAEEDLLITRDNEFGNAEEDALRRDFTVNALFLDPTRDLIVDHVNGLVDLEARVIRTIGDPRVRFREDPVRILRAAKFAGRLGFSIEKHTYAAMAETAEDLVRAAPPRVLEEILRLLRSGHALDSFQLLRDIGALEYLVPVLDEFLASAAHGQRVACWRLLDALDQHVQAGHEVPQNGVLLAAMLYGPVAAEAEHQPARSASSIAEELLGPLANSLRLPRRDSGCLKRICGVQHRFVQAEEKRRFRIDSFVHSPYFAEALQLFELRTIADDGDFDVVDDWHRLAGTPAPSIRGDDDDEDGDEDRHAREAEATTAPPQKPRRRRRQRRRHDDEQESGRAEHAHVADDESHGASHGESDESYGDDSDAGHKADQGTAERRFDPRDDDEEDDDEKVGDDAGQSRDESDDEAQDRQSTATAAPADDDDAPRRKRRRRRRRRSGRRDQDDEVFPPSEAPAPHGDPRRGSVRAAPTDFDEDTFPLDEAAREPVSRQSRRDDAYDDEAAPEREDEHVDRDQRDHDDDRPDGKRGEGNADRQNVDRDAGDRDGDRGPRSRRRRSRRGRGRGKRREGDDENRARPERNTPERDAGDRDRPSRDRPERTAASNRERNEPGREPGRERGGSRAADNKPRPHGRESRKRGRGKKQGGQRGGGGNRDVDVVPRYRDRRGKVEVIEPVSLDLSAFDVELDPKRVPTFGSIVEGKGRPKRRGPRMPDKSEDEYRPPPPPGSDSSPGASPPPPAHDDDDTFGDW